MEYVVKPKLTAIVIVVILAGSSQLASAQRGEVSLNYSLIDYNPAKSLAGSRDLHGGGGSIGLNLGEYFTLKGEFEGYTSTTLTFHVPSTPNSAPGTFSTQANMFTYLFGLQLNISKPRSRWFGETLFGAAYTNAYANLFKAAGVSGLSVANNGFAMAIGGGLDIPVSKRIALRPAQLDYFLTRYEWKPLGINNQSNFRYQAGVVFAFGKYY